MRLRLALIYLVLLSSCHTGGTQGAPGDVAQLSDVNREDSGVTDTSNAVSETDGSTESDTCPVASDLWRLSNFCEGEVSYPPTEEPFAIPQRGSMDHPPIRTKEQIVADFGGMPAQGFAILPDESLAPGPGKTFDLYGSPDQDISFHIYALVDSDYLSTYRLNVVTMVDYAPVESKYIRWDPKRENTWLEETTTGVNFPFRSKVEILDVTIPRAIFAEQRMYEISISVEMTTPERSPMGTSRRFALYNGGYSRPSRPCTEPRLSSQLSAVEQEMDPRFYSDGIGSLFLPGRTSVSEIRGEIGAQPGETMELLLSIWRMNVGYGSKDTVLVPLLNGKPTGPIWWVSEGGAEEEYLDYIDARKSFEVTFPEEPGIYEVQVVSWTDPYEIWRTRDGTVREGISDGSGLYEGSNALRFIVEESN